MAIHHYNGTIVKVKNAEPDVFLLSDSLDDVEEQLIDNDSIPNFEDPPLP